MVDYERKCFPTLALHHSQDYIFWSFRINELMLVCFEYTILLKPGLGGVHFSVSLINRLIKTESGIFAPFVISLLLKDFLFHNLLIVTAADVKCSVAALKGIPVLTHSQDYIFWSSGSMSSCLCVLNIHYCLSRG